MINLLPLQFQKELAEEKKKKIVLNLGILFLSFFTSLSLILFLIEIHISLESKNQKALSAVIEQQFKSSELAGVQVNIIQANQDLLKLKSFYQDQVSLTETMEEIYTLLPEGIRVQSATFQKSDKQISLSGFSLQRETLLELKKNLEQAESLQEVYFPPSNWIAPKEVNFYITFKVR